MKFFTSILGSEKDRAAKKRRSLEVNLHRLEEKAFLLEMELEETKREREKVLKELRSKIPVRHVSTVSVSSTDYSFNTDNSNSADRYCCLPIESSTPKDEKIHTLAWKDQKKAKLFEKEEEDRASWTTADLIEKAEKKNNGKMIEKY